MRAGFASTTLIALAAFAVVAPVAASPALSASSAWLEDAEASSPDARLAQMRGIGPAASVTSWHLEAANLEIHAYESEGIEAVRNPVTGYVVDTTGASGAEASSTVSYKDAKALLDGQDSSFAVLVFSSEPFRLRTASADTQVDPIKDPILTRTGISEDATREARDGNMDFSAVRAHGEYVKGVVEEANVELSFTGDFVLEIEGLALDVDGTIHDGRTTREGFTGQPTIDDEAHWETRRFLRLLVTGGSLQARLNAADTQFQWAAPEVLSDSSALALVDSDGAVPEGPLHVTLGTQDGRLTVLPHAPEPEPATNARAVPGDLTLVVLFAVLTLISLATTVALAVRAARAVPPMDEVEDALQRRSFTRAAKLSGRILQRRPHMQEAMLSRAIALARLGQHRQLVSEVETYLDKRGATDGTLHYVLGLAYIDMGQDAAGRARLAEAARRTPDLEAQVAPHMAPTPPAGGTAYA